MSGSTSNRRVLIIVVSVVAGGVLMLVLIACGLGGLGFWGWQVFNDQAKDALNRNPVIQRHIGPIAEIEMDIVATGNAPGADVFVFRISGPSGSGVVTAEFITIDADTEELGAGTLQLDNGETYNLNVGR